MIIIHNNPASAAVFVLRDLFPSKAVPERSRRNGRHLRSEDLEGADEQPVMLDQHIQSSLCSLETTRGPCQNIIHL